VCVSLFEWSGVLHTRLIIVLSMPSCLFRVCSFLLLQHCDDDVCARVRDDVCLLDAQFK
jgi:hypothetical protein